MWKKEEGKKNEGKGEKRKVKEGKKREALVRISKAGAEKDQVGSIGDMGTHTMQRDKKRRSLW